MTEHTLADYQFKTDPFSHQFEEFKVSRDAPLRAIFWEQGTGKTKLIIDTMAWLYLTGKIDTVVVMAPAGVHRNWISDELPVHLPDRVFHVTRTHVFQTVKSRTKWHQKLIKELVEHKGFSFLAIPYDGIVTEPGKDALWDLLSNRRVMLVADESHKIKTHSAGRTEVAVAMAPYAAYRRILSGTPISVGPLDTYSQLMFLDNQFWVKKKLHPFMVFKTHFGIYKRREILGSEYRDRKTGEIKLKAYDQLVGYKNIPELNGHLSKISSRVTKEDVLDLPEKLYTYRYYEMTPEQERLYDSLKNEYMALMSSEGECENCAGSGRVAWEGWDGECPVCEGTAKKLGGLVTADLVIVRLLRFQQLLCGYLPVETFEEDKQPELQLIPGGNPRLDLLGEVVEGLVGSFIIFARFTKDIDLILEKLAELKISAVRYDGKVDDEQRAENKRKFQAGEARVFVANQQLAAEGLTLVIAKTVIYYSNSFKLIDRLQSEDRAHRIGQKDNVLYIDLTCEGTIDKQIIANLKKKFDIAREITGDRVKEWLA